MRKLILLAVVLVLAACAENPTPAIPTAEDMTVQPTVTAASEMADDATPEATVEVTADMTAEAEGTEEVAMNPTFRIEVSGDTETTIDSEDGAIVTDEMSGSPTQGESAPLMNTPVTSLRILRFMAADQSYTFELTFSQNTIAEGEYEIGVDNVSDTVGNNANEDSTGADSVSTVAESTAESTADSGTSSTLNTPSATVVNDSSDNAGSSITSNDPPAVGPGQGVIETDETLAPIIAARLVPEDGEGTEYNLVESGTLTIDSLTERGVSGSFEFQLASTQDMEQTVTVSGTFTDIPFSEFDDESATPAP